MAINNLSASGWPGEMIVEFTMIMRLGKIFKTVRLLEPRELGENANKASFLESRAVF